MIARVLKIELIARQIHQIAIEILRDGPADEVHHGERIQPSGRDAVRNVRDLGAFYLSPTGSQPGQTRQDIEFQERTLRATVSQLLGRQWALGAAYRLTDSELDSKFPDFSTSPALDSFSRQDQEARLHQVTLYANFFNRLGFFGQWWSTWSHQENDGYSPGLAEADFWQHNVSVGYRLPQRRAELRLSLLNLTDQDYQLNPLTLYRELPRERTLAVSLKFYF